jgi:hypothetical protein
MQSISVIGYGLSSELFSNGAQLKMREWTYKRAILDSKKLFIT